MAQTATLEQLTAIFRDVFDDDDLTASATMTADDVEGWDSLANVRLFVALEQDLGIRFSSSEMTSLRNVGELADLIERKRASR